MVLWALAEPGQYQTEAKWSNASWTVTSVVASATTHTKGAWAEVEAETGSEWQGVVLVGRSTTATAATDTSALLDVGIGAAGSETVILANLPHGYLIQPWTVVVPQRIPSGVRVALRRQSAVSSNSEDFALIPWAGAGFTGGGSFQSAVTYGANESTSQGVTVTCSSNTTFGDWTEIAAATSAPIRALIVAVQLAGDVDITGTTFRLEFGFGSAGSEVAIDCIGQSSNSSEATNGSTGATPYAPRLIVPRTTIPEGARLAARLMTANVTYMAAVDVVLIGLR